MLIQNIVEIFQSDKRRLYGDFQKITLQKDDLIINQDQGKFICTGRFVESIIGLSGNKDEVNNEIFYRYEIIASGFSHIYSNEQYFYHPDLSDWLLPELQ